MTAATPDQSGRRAIVTGANTGLGFQTALALARAGAEVVLAVRSSGRGEAAAARIRHEIPDASVRVSELDLADLASVRAFAARERSAGPLDLLVNNAGVMLVPQRRFTADGFEMHMGVNHLGHAALTLLLLPALLRASPGFRASLDPRAPSDVGASPGFRASLERTVAGGRVVVVGSAAHVIARPLDAGLGTTGRYRPMAAYAASKLAGLLFAFELDRRLRLAGAPVTALAAHPGWTATELMDRDDAPGPFVRLSRWATQVMGSAPQTAAASVLRAATDQGLAGGAYLGPTGLLRGRPHRARPSRRARDQTAARWLFDLTAERTGTAFEA